MSLCTNCKEKFFGTQIPDSPLPLEQLRWEFGPASIPNVEEVIQTLRNVQQELEACETQIEALVSRRQSLRAYTVHLQALISPFRKVPDELLQRIFNDCDDMNHFVVNNPKETGPGAGGNMPALVLTSVCSRWRRNGLSMPSIWSSISLMCHQKDVAHDKQQLLSTLDIFLNRGLQHPLTINVELGPNFDEQQVPTFVAPLISHQHRWHSFTYRSGRSNLLSLFSHLGYSALTPPHFPLLENVDLGDVKDKDLKIFNHRAPKLKSLILSGSIPPPRSSLEISLFAQLSHLEFHHPFDYEIQALTDTSHRLVSLETEESVNRIPFSVGAVAVLTCHTIETLTVYHDPSITRAGSVFAFLTLPSLKAILLKRNGYHERKLRSFVRIRQGDWDNFDPFMTFLSRSSCSLTNLAIESLALADSKLINVLSHIPTLLDLIIDDSFVMTKDSPITSQFIESLGVNHANSLHLLPKLYSLKLNIGASTFNDASVVEMVRSRWTPRRFAGGESVPQVDCLREFTLRFRTRKEVKGVYRPLEDIEKAGMRAVVLWETGKSRWTE